MSEDEDKKAEAFEKYGLIFAPVDKTTWDDVTLASNLKTKGTNYLNNQAVMLKSSIEASAADLGLIDENKYNFLWIVDWPSFEYDEEEQRYVAAHHPFTMPKDEWKDKLLTDPDKCYSKCYDIVLNGYELGSGSIRIHNQNIQETVFKALELSEEDINNKYISKNIPKEILEVLDAYHEICKSFPKVIKVTPARQKQIRDRLAAYTMEEIKTVFRNAEGSDFLKGKTGKWKADFDWLMGEKNIVKVLEGKYADERKETGPVWRPREFDEDEQRAIQRMLNDDSLGGAI